MIWLVLIFIVYFLVCICVRCRRIEMNMYERHLMADREQAKAKEIEAEKIWLRVRAAAKIEAEKNRIRSNIRMNIFAFMKTIGWYRDEYRRQWITPCGVVLDDRDVAFSPDKYVRVIFHIPYVLLFKLQKFLVPSIYPSL